MTNDTTISLPRELGYDTLTAWCESPGFKPDVSKGWEGTRSLQLNDRGQHSEKWVLNRDGWNCTLRTTTEHPESSSLFVQISLPRVLSGNNFVPWSPGASGIDTYEAELDIDRHIWKRLSHDLPDFPDWRLSRLDVTEHYHLPGGEPQVHSALNALLLRRIPSHRSRPYRSETGNVMWSGKSRNFVAYSKYVEVFDMTGDRNLAEMARGVLRAEARVVGAKGIHRVLAKHLGVAGNDPVTVHDIMVPAALPVAVERVMGKLEDTVTQAIGTTIGESSIGIDELTERLGATEAARVIGYHLLYQARGEEWLREHMGTRQNFHKIMKKLRDLGVDPRTVDLGLSKQLRLFDTTLPE